MSSVRSDAMATAALLDRTFDALANEHRRDIVRRLRGGPIDTPTIGAEYPMSKQALHRHVVVLEEAGLITRRRSGRTQRLELSPEPLGEVTRWVDEIRRGWHASAERLGALLETDTDTETGGDPAMPGSLAAHAHDERK